MHLGVPVEGEGEISWWEIIIQTRAIAKAKSQKAVVLILMLQVLMASCTCFMWCLSQVERMERYGGYIFHEDCDWCGKQEIYGHQDQSVRVMLISDHSFYY